ncbi:MAG: nitrogen fixation protein NifQ [Telluria sp.]
MHAHGYAELMAAARSPGDPATLAFAGVIALAPQRAAPYDVPIAGLDGAALQALAAHIFPDLKGPLVALSCGVTGQARFDEFDDLLALLLEHRSCMDQQSRWLAHALATAAMGDNHLWQDLGLPGRGALSWLMRSQFTSLAQLNSGDMKWKKFFYRQLCEREGLTLCRSPSCGVCSDYRQCFGSEQALAVER